MAILIDVEALAATNLGTVSPHAFDARRMIATVNRVDDDAFLFGIGTTVEIRNLALSEFFVARNKDRLVGIVITAPVESSDGFADHRAAVFVAATSLEAKQCFGDFIEII